MVDGVDAVLRELEAMLVFRGSIDGRPGDVGVGERARDEAIEGRGDDRVDIMGEWWCRESVLLTA